MEKERRRKKAYRKAIKDGRGRAKVVKEAANEITASTELDHKPRQVADANTLTELIMADVDAAQRNYDLLRVAFELLENVCLEYVNLEDIKQGRATSELERELVAYIRSGKAHRTQGTLGLLESVFTDKVGKVDAHGALVYNKK